MARRWRRTGKVPMPAAASSCRRARRARGRLRRREPVVLVRNSWGAKWGIKGYFEMPYGYLTDPQLAATSGRSTRSSRARKLRGPGGARRRGRRRQVRGSGQRPPDADRGRGVRPGAFAGDRLDLPALPPAGQAEGVLDRLGADLLPGPPRRDGAAALHRVRSRADRADRAPHAGRRRRPARAGIPRQARAHALVPLRQRVSVRAAPELGHGAPTSCSPSPMQKAWRNQFFDAVRPGARRCGRRLRRECAEGARPVGAQAECSRRAHSRIPSSRDAAQLLARLARRRSAGCGRIVTPDPDGDATGPNYGASFRESDYAPIPRRDLPFGVPEFLGDDAAGRTGHPRHNNVSSGRARTTGTR